MHKDWYVALVDANTPFDPVAHRRRDLPLKRVNLSGAEDDEVDRLGLVCVRHTDAPTLADGAPRWVHLSRELADGSLRHMGYGYVIPTPKRGDDETEVFEFNLSPFDWARTKLVAAQALKVLPFFDLTTVSPDSRNDVSEILDGYSAVPHCHRSTHDVSFPEITGSDLDVIEAPDPWMPGPTVDTIGTPLAAVDVDSTAEWVQARDGDLDATELVQNAFKEGARLFNNRVNTLTPEELERSWFKRGENVNGDSGWKVVETTFVRKLDLPAADYPNVAGPFRGPTTTYNYVKDPNLKAAVGTDTSLERAWYTTTLKLAYTIRQKRVQRIMFRLVNGGQRWQGGEVKQLSVRLEDVSRDDVTPYWRPLQLYKAGTLWKVGTTVYSCLRDHRASRFFDQDVLVTGANGGIVQQWVETIGDQSALGDKSLGTYWPLPRGEMTFRNLALKARALILHSMRCIEIKFRHALTDELLDLTTANRVRLRAPADMLRGAPGRDGVVVAKVYSYEIVSDQEDEYIEVTLRACVGSGIVYDSVGRAVVTQTGEAWDRIIYGDYTSQVPEPLPEIEADVKVTNKVPEQVAAVLAADYRPDAVPPRKDATANDPKNIIKTVPTAVQLFLTQISGRPDMAHDIIVPVPFPFTGPCQWSVVEA